MKRWQKVLIIVCVVWLVGALLAIMLLRDTPEFPDGEASLMVSRYLDKSGDRYTTITEKYLGQGLWEVRTKILPVWSTDMSWHPIVFIVEEKTCEIRVREYEIE